MSKMQQKSSTIILTCILVSIASAQIIIDDGGYHLIDYETSDVLVVGGVGTLVEFTDGAITPSGLSVGAVEGGRIRMSGGHLGWSLIALDDSVVSVSGGYISGQLDARSSQPVEMSGGTVGLSAVAGFNGHLNFAGGTIKGKLELQDTGTATVTGGVIEGDLYLYHDTHATVSGGKIGGNIRLGSHNWVSDCSVTFDGSNFAVNGQPVSFGELATTYALSDTHRPTGKPFYYGTVTGTLANGDLLNNRFIIYDDSDITFVPEPATLLLLGLGGIMLRKRRQA